MSIVTLKPWEILLAAQVGVMRQVENLKLGRKAAYGATDESHWQIHIEGALGEYALAKYLGVFWNGKGTLRAPDVGDIDCRTAKRFSDRLILHKEDPNDRVFWLLCGAYGFYRVKGWILGAEGKNPNYWSEPVQGRPAFFVPDHALNPPETGLRRSA